MCARSANRTASGFGWRMVCVGLYAVFALTGCGVNTELQTELNGIKTTVNSIRHHTVGIKARVDRARDIVTAGGDLKTISNNPWPYVGIFLLLIAGGVATAYLFLHGGKIGGAAVGHVCQKAIRFVVKNGRKHSELKH